MYLQLKYPVNEPVLSYKPGSVERAEIKKALADLKSKVLDIPMYIDGKEVRTQDKKNIYPPHEIKHCLGSYHQGDATHVQQAIQVALQAKETWQNMSWENRANIFLRAAELLSTKYRYIMNAATMLGQSKNVMQAEIDSACELVDFLRYNVYFLNEIYKQQPNSPSTAEHNRIEWLPLEGFVLAVTPFNFTAIGGNLCTVPAMSGNVVIWKPAKTQIYSAYVFMQVLIEAGLPAGVINLIYVDSLVLGDTAFKHPDFSGFHFTGSTTVFEAIHKTIAENLSVYRSYPRVVGETGGKNFVIAHRSAQVSTLVTALIRGAFEYQGQKCSAASRAYIPSNLTDLVKSKLVESLQSIKVGSVEDFSNFMNAVIDKKAFDKIVHYLNQVKQSPHTAKILFGGYWNEAEGYFVAPTLVETTDPKFMTMCEEIFGPVLTLYTYPENEFEKTLKLANETSPYGLTGSIIAQDRYAIEKANDILKYAAGNFYINDKPTGAVVGQQPFSGGRKSGTNDKEGSLLHLYRFLNARVIKENFAPPTNFEYPFMVGD